jgi:rubrerythrin
MDSRMPKKSQAVDQYKTFRKVARELGADESDERFKETLRTLAKHRKPQPQAKKSRP